MAMTIGITTLSGDRARLWRILDIETPGKLITDSEDAARIARECGWTVERLRRTTAFARRWKGALSRLDRLHVVGANDARWRLARIARLEGVPVHLTHARSPRLACPACHREHGFSV